MDMKFRSILFSDYKAFTGHISPKTGQSAKLAQKTAFKSLLLLVTLGITASLPAAAQTTKQLKTIDSLMQASNARGVFNGTILIAGDQKIFYHKAFGYADASRTKKLSTDMRFDIGSISKEFNGVSIMLLKEKGKLTLEDPVSMHLSGLPKWADSVTLRHLISYTSGIPTFTAQSDETDAELHQYITGLKQLRFAPGTAYLYAGANVYLQRRIIEKLSGLSYSAFLEKYIFAPCGMKSSTVDADLTRADVAKAFDNDFAPTPYQQKSTGFVRLTANDLYKFTSKLESFKLISESSFKELAANFPGGESSLGSTAFENGKLLWHRHQGSNSNYEALLYTDHAQHTSIFMLTNNQNFKVDALKTANLNNLKGQPYAVPKKSLYLDIRDKMVADMEKGLAFYRQIKANASEKYDLGFEAGDLISTGKYLQRRSRYDDAITLFQFAAPLCARASDLSYAQELTGECYLKKGDTNQAKAWYEKALKTNPANKNAKGMLATLQ
jgi:CubicO group peptidase (beta-lactamase class C family)